MGKIAEVKDIVDAVLYLAQAGQVTGEISTWMVVLTLAVGSGRQFGFMPQQVGPWSEGLTRQRLWSSATVVKTCAK